MRNNTYVAALILLVLAAATAAIMLFTPDGAAFAKYVWGVFVNCLQVLLPIVWLFGAGLAVFNMTRSRSNGWLLVGIVLLGAFVFGFVTKSILAATMGGDVSYQLDWGITSIAVLLGSFLGWSLA